MPPRPGSAPPTQYRDQSVGLGSYGGLMRIKPLDLILREADEPQHRLRRSMGVVSLTSLGVAAIVGAGIFVLTGVVAAQYAGPGIILSYVLAGIVSGLAALCYAELASTVPVSGSAYTYSYAVLGEFIAWIIGWDLVLEYAVGAGAVSVGWSGYFTDFMESTFGVSLPAALTASPFSHPAGILNVPAAVILLLLTALLIRGTSESSKVNNVIVALKIAIVLFFIFVGVTHVHPANWQPFLPYGLGGVTTGASIIFFAYIGFDTVSTAGEEARDPQRTLPRGIIFSLLICTLLYIAVAAVLTGMVPYRQLNTAAPVAYAMLRTGLNWAGTIISLGALAGLTTVLLVLLFGQSRILFAMARDGLLPKTLSRVHGRFRTPYRATLLVGMCVAFLGALTPIDILAQLTSVGTLTAFVLVSLAVWRLRVTQPDRPRGFRVPWVPAIPVLSVLASLFLIARMPSLTLVRFVVWLSVGLIVYFAYSRHHSELQKHEARASATP